MTKSRLALYLIGFAVLYAGGYLAWEVTHGGVVTHHFAADKNMPGFSNWWGLLVLPLIGALAAWSVQRNGDGHAVRNAGIAALVACIAGIALSVAFSVDRSGNVPLYLLLAVLASALVFPTYRAEYIYGWVLGCSVDFGLVLPAIIALVPATISVVAFFAIRPAFTWTVQRMRNNVSS